MRVKRDEYVRRSSAHCRWLAGFKREKADPIFDRPCRRAIAVVSVIMCAHFPWNMDQTATPKPSGSSRLFYEQAYSSKSSLITYPAAKVNLPSESPQFAPLSEFVRQYGLQGKRALEIGAGAGALQDVVEHYVGLDILSGHFKTGQWWSPQNRPMENAVRTTLVIPCSASVRQGVLG